MITLAWTGAYRLTRPDDDEKLNHVEQMIDLGDAKIDPLDLVGVYTHRVDFTLGQFWLIRMEEN